MQRQVMAIHGGTSFDSYEDYISFIKTRELTREKLLQGEDWKGSLTVALGDAFEVLLPRMPNSTNVRYAEWVLWFERCAEFLRDDVVLVGHSLGGIFLAKYLSEHAAPFRIQATFLVGAPVGDTTTDESLTEFVLPASLDGFAEQGGAIHILHSKDDPVVPVAEAIRYKELLPTAELVLFEDRGHFNQKTFPELVERIRSL